MKKILTLVLALAMIFACSVPAWALSDTSSTYTQSAIEDASESPSSMTVYLSIQSDYVGGYAIDRGYYTVSMASSDYTDGVCRVGDVLRKAASTYSWLKFYNSSGTYLSGGPSDYVYGVADTTVNSGNTIFTPLTSINSRVGWMFRVNRKYVLLDSEDYPYGYSVSDSGPCGAAIEEAIVNSGDKIDLYYANAGDSSYCTNKIYIEPIVNSSGKYGIKIWSSYSWYDTQANNWYWHIDTNGTTSAPSYAIVPSTSFSISVDGTTATYTTNSSGNIYFSNLTSGSGSHTIKVYPTYTYYSDGTIYYGVPKYTGMSVSFTL